MEEFPSSEGNSPSEDGNSSPSPKGDSPPDEGKSTFCARKVTKRDCEGIPYSVIREIGFLSHLSHPNIMPVLNTNMDDKSAYFDMPICDAFPTSMTMKEIRKYSRQLLEGVKYLHDHDIIHRDLKPQNLLIDKEKDLLKIADFGLAVWSFTDSATHMDEHVQTLWYRAPELVLNMKKYGKPIDIWRVGCIIAEMFIEESLFPGSNIIFQAFEIFKYSNLAHFPEESFPPDASEDRVFRKSPQLEHMLTKNVAYSYDAVEMILKRGSGGCRVLPKSFIDLVGRLLILNPTYRITAEDALSHPFFKEQDIL